MQRTQRHQKNQTLKAFEQQHNTPLQLASHLQRSS